MNEQPSILDSDIRHKLHSYVPALVEVDESWEALKTRYPQILADLTSSKFNPNCSCRQRVGSFLNEKYESSEDEKQFILKLFSIPKVVEKSAEVLVSSRRREKAYQEFPRVHSVPKGEQAWADFLKFLEKNDFHPQSFSVVDKGETVTVYLM